jgi:hypothetical protein
MAKKPGAIYEPGELEKVRGRLGPVDESEAKRMAKKLGGDVGTEKSVVVPPPRKNSGQLKREKVELSINGQKSRRPLHSVETVGLDDIFVKAASRVKHENDPSDDPSIQLKTSYFERVKMDKYAAQAEFEIKNSLQVITSIFSFVGDPVDYINNRFVSRRLGVYYKEIEHLVNSTRGVFPRNNARRSERLKKTSPYFYSILDTIRHWDIERIDIIMTKIQSHPRSVTVSELAEIIRIIYKPLFILEKLNMDIHIKGAFKLLYKLIYIENPLEPKDKNQDLMRIALASFTDIRREVHFGLYPLLM